MTAKNIFIYIMYVNSGGLCLKKCESMSENRGSMAGAAVALGTFKALAELKVPS